MSQIYHNNAVTNSHTRSYIQSATESVADLALKHRTSEKTIIKWQKRDFINDTLNPSFTASMHVACTQ